MKGWVDGASILTNLNPMENLGSAAIAGNDIVLSSIDLVHNLLSPS